MEKCTQQKKEIKGSWLKNQTSRRLFEHPGAAKDSMITRYWTRIGKKNIPASDPKQCVGRSSEGHSSHLYKSHDACLQDICLCLLHTWFLKICKNHVFGSSMSPDTSLSIHTCESSLIIRSMSSDSCLSIFISRGPLKDQCAPTPTNQPTNTNQHQLTPTNTGPNHSQKNAKKPTTPSQPRTRTKTEGPGQIRRPRCFQILGVTYKDSSCSSRECSEVFEMTPKSPQNANLKLQKSIQKNRAELPQAPGPWLWKTNFLKLRHFLAAS